MWELTWVRTYSKVTTVNGLNYRLDVYLDWPCIDSLIVVAPQLFSKTFSWPNSSLKKSLVAAIPGDVATLVQTCIATTYMWTVYRHPPTKQNSSKCRNENSTSYICPKYGDVRRCKTSIWVSKTYHKPGSSVTMDKLNSWVWRCSLTTKMIQQQLHLLREHFVSVINIKHCLITPPPHNRLRLAIGIFSLKLIGAHRAQIMKVHLGGRTLIWVYNWNTRLSLI